MTRQGFVVAFLFTILPACSSAATLKIFQQEVHTTIDVALDDKAHALSGTISMEYVNHSPDTLREIYFHLWPNAYQDNSMLAGQLLDQGLNNLHRTKREERGFIDGLDFQVDGKKAQFNYLSNATDIGLLKLPSPLLPGQRVFVSTPFYVKIPSAAISRLGHTDQAYYITQWYPKPAVYDRDGWQYFSYLHQGEFYGEYGNFDVTITLPSNYVVAATGVLQDTAERRWLEGLAKDTQPPVAITPPSDSKMKVLHYRAERVHDFAWFADKRFKVEKGESVLPSGKKVSTWAFYTNNQPEYWSHALQYMDESLRKFSAWFGEYPYPQAIAVDGLSAEGRDMEYPMITLLGESPDLFTFEITVAHELGHFWFYGLLGNNERRGHAWLDEGLSNYCETRYVKSKYAPGDPVQDEQTGFYGLADMLYSRSYNHRQAQDFVYRSQASMNIDMASNFPPLCYPPLQYLGEVYYKPCIGLDYMQTVLGDSVFDDCMKRYVSEWSYHHPDPDAMAAAFSGTGSDWFFRTWVQSRGKIDYKIESMVVSEGAAKAGLKNSGHVSPPFYLSGFAGKQLVSTMMVPGFAGDTVVTFPCPGCDELVIDAGEQMPEVNRQNNTIRTDGLFKKLEPLRFRFGGGAEPVRTTTLFWSPVAGYNKYDGVLTGGVLSNLSLVEKSMEFLIMPLYGWNSGQLSGGGRVMANLHPASHLFSRISVGPGISHYSLSEKDETPGLQPLSFTRVSFDIEADFIQSGLPQLNQNCREYIRLRAIYTATDRVESSCFTCEEAHSIVTDDRIFAFLDYVKEKRYIFHPWTMKLSAGINKHFYRLSLEYSKTLSYSERGRGLEFRLFAGKTGKAFHNEDDVFLDHRLHMAGLDGHDDYLYEGTFVERSDPGTQQFIRAEGGFAVPTNYGQANWLVAVNVSTIIHPVLPVRLYFNMGTYQDAGTTVATDNKLMYEAGIEIYALPGVLAVYLPLTYSSEIDTEFAVNGLKYKDKVRFELNLQRLNPFISLKEKMRHGPY